MTNSSRLLATAVLIHAFEAVTGHAQTVDLIFQGASRLNSNHLVYQVVGDPNVKVRELATGQTIHTQLPLTPAQVMLAETAGRFTLFGVDEAGVDRNGDGDANDTVVHAFDSATGVIHNLALALSGGKWMWLADPHALIAVPESAQGADLNGDGDVGDVVLHTVHLPSGNVVNTGFGEASLPSITFRDRMVAGIALETSTDIDGDGTIFGLVPFLLEARFNGLLPVTGPAAIGALVLGDGFAAYLTDELSGVDWNNDGDTGDIVPVIVDLATAVGVPLPFAASNTSMFAVADRLVFYSSEAAQGVDQNGDGDHADIVTRILDPITLTHAPIGVTPAVPSLTTQRAFHEDGERLVIGIRESGDGVDRNGDGDAVDLVLHSIDLSTLESQNLAVAVPEIGDWPVHLDDGLLALVAPEGINGRDLNGDGDSLDYVAMVLDLKVNATLSISTGSFAEVAGLSSPRSVFLLSENAHGTDLNNDGDTNDYVHQVFDYSSGELVNLAVSGNYAGPAAFDIWYPIPMSGLHVLAIVSESMEGMTDLDGNGDAFGKVTMLIAVDAPSCGAIYDYGEGCSGLQGMPALGVAGCPVVNGAVTLSVSGGVSNGVAVLLLGRAREPDPSGPCPLLVQDVFPAVQVLPLDPSGAFSLSTTLPPGTSLAPVAAQALVVDASAPLGYASSNAVQVNVLSP